MGARPAAPSPAHTRGDRIASGCARGSRRPRWRVAAAVCRSGSTRDGADDDCCARGAAGVSRPHNACAVQERWVTPPRRYAGSARLVDSGDRRFVSAVRVPGSPRSLGATPPPGAATADARCGTGQIRRDNRRGWPQGGRRVPTLRRRRTCARGVCFGRRRSAFGLLALWACVAVILDEVNVDE